MSEARGAMPGPPVPPRSGGRRAVLIVGANPRREAAVMNARIRKRWRAGKFPVGVIGERADLTYSYDYLGAGPETLADLAAFRANGWDVDLLAHARRGVAPP